MMFYKIIYHEVDEGDIENGPGVPREVCLCVCRAVSKQEASIILKLLLEAQNLTWTSDMKIVEATEEEYEDFLYFSQL